MQENCEKNKEESLSRLHVQLEAEKNRLKEISKDNEEKDEILKRINDDLKKANEDSNKLIILQSGRFSCSLNVTILSRKSF